MNGRIGYRLLLRTANSVFKNDHYAIKSAKVKLREEFLKHRNVDNPTELAELYKGIEEVDEMLKFNIVQGALNDRGNYEVRLTPENQVTIEAHQDLPSGAQLEPIDRSLVGEIHIDKVPKRAK